MSNIFTGKSDAILCAILDSAKALPLPSLCEAWLDTALDEALWTAVNPLTGGAWTIATHTTGHRCIFAHPALSEDAEIYTNRPVLVNPLGLQTDSVVRKAVIEFEMKLSSVSNIDNTLFFVGIGAALSARTADYIIGWGLNADALVSVTDDSGLEETNTGFGATLTNWNKLRVELTYGHAKFYVNEVLKADHVTRLPKLSDLFTVVIATEATGDAYIYLGTVRTWMEDTV